MATTPAGLPLLGTAGYLAHDDEQSKRAIRQNQGMKFDTVNLTPDGYETKTQTLNLPESLPEKRWYTPWVSTGEVYGEIEGLLRKQGVDITAEQGAQIRRHIEDGMRSADAIRTGLTDVASVQKEKVNQAKFAANQERSQMYERMMAQDIASSRQESGRFLDSLMSMRFVR